MSVRIIFYVVLIAIEYRFFTMTVTIFYSLRCTFPSIIVYLLINKNQGNIVIYEDFTSLQLKTLTINYVILRK